MLITVNHFSSIANKKINENMASALQGLQFGGVEIGLQKSHRLAMFLAQTAHESMGWTYDREIWGPTAAQRRYEGRSDLGNTQKGDGSLFKGYTPMQITGRYNTTRFYNWCKKTFPTLNVPDFTKSPHLMNTDPWEGLGPIWYWAYGKAKSLNLTADVGDFISNTKLVNGGLNGIDDRYRYYGRAALVLLGRDPSNIKEYQRANGLVPDGIVGSAKAANTALSLHRALLKMPEVRFTDVVRKPVIVSPLTAFFNKLLGI